MTRASELKKADVIEHNGGLFVIRQIDVQSPSARGAATLYRVRAQQVGGGSKFENRFKGDDDVPTVSLVRRPVHFSYLDGDDYVFMDDEDFSQYPIKGEDIADELAFITEDGEGLLALRVGEAVIGLELPASVVLAITETAPAWSPMVESATAAACCTSAFAGCKRAVCTNPAAACCTELMTWSWNSALVPPTRSCTSSARRHERKASSARPLDASAIP